MLQRNWKLSIYDPSRNSIYSTFKNQISKSFWFSDPIPHISIYNNWTLNNEKKKRTNKKKVFQVHVIIKHKRDEHLPTKKKKRISHMNEEMREMLYKYTAMPILPIELNEYLRQCPAAIAVFPHSPVCVPHRVCRMSKSNKNQFSNR